MPAPLQLDTSREDWRRQARGKAKCKGPTCGADILWIMFEGDDGRDWWVPYNDSDGRLHRDTCPSFVARKRDKAITPAKVPEAAAKPAQADLFRASNRYGGE